MTKQDIFVKNLKRLIKDKFKQQKLFAHEMQIGENMLSFWLTKKSFPSLETLLKISELCNLPISYFFEEESNIDSQQVINEDIFNEVFSLAFDFAKKNNLEIKGSLFLGCYDLVVEQQNKDNSKEIKDIFEELKPFLLRFMQKG